MISIKEILLKIKQLVYLTEPSATIILYGSLARGQSNKQSDIDILIIVDNDKITYADEQRIKYPLYDLEFETIIHKTTEYEETRYLFTLAFDHNFIQEIGCGIYLISYNCNPSLKVSDSGKEPHLSALKVIHSNEICLICNNTNKSHKILLINSVEYLSANTSHAKYSGAIEFAQNDREWLLLPFDPLPSVQQHRSTRIPRADFWYAEHYKAIGENRPEFNHI